MKFSLMGNGQDTVREKENVRDRCFLDEKLRIRRRMRSERVKLRLSINGKLKKTSLFLEGTFKWEERKAINFR